MEALVNSDTNLQLVCDFVNTLDREQGIDELAEATGLDAWLRARGLWTSRSTAEDAAAARDLREALRDLMRANNGCDSDAGRPVAALDAASARTGVRVRFSDRGLRLDAPEGGVSSVLAAVGMAMMDGSWTRLKACRSDSCRWAFVDNARNRSRQWCSMQVCGNREKARAFRLRHGADAA